jgi:hypothetical protein
MWNNLGPFVVSFDDKMCIASFCYLTLYSRSIDNLQLQYT